MISSNVPTILRAAPCPPVRYTATTRFEELRGRGAVLVYHPTVQPCGMKEVATRDPDGHVLGVGPEWT